MPTFVLHLMNGMMLAAFPLFLNLGSGEIFLIVLLIVLFFGTDKLPEMMRGFARGMREMRNAAGELQREIENSANEVKRDLNLQEHIDEIAASARTMGNTINEELDELDAADASEKPVPPVTVIHNPVSIQDPETVTPVADVPPAVAPPAPADSDNPLTPPNIISRNG